MMKRKFLLLLWLLPPAVYAQEISTDRPDQTESPFVLPFRTLQIESGVLKSKEGSVTNFETPSVLWRISLLEPLELRLITTYSRIKNGNHKLTGFEAVEAGFKLKVCDEKGIRPQVGFIQHVVFPEMASENFKNENYGINFRFAAQHTLNERISISYNAGMEWSGNDSESEFIYTLASGFGLTEKLSGFLEVFGNIPENRSSVHRFDGGLTYLLLPELQLDASAGADFKNPSENFFLSAGISWRFSTAKKLK